MMRSEFIERTGFEPTADEYREIEAEYYGYPGDKDEYCKQWKKSGGAQRLMRVRAGRIEDLESKVACREKHIETLNAKVAELEACVSGLKEDSLEKLRVIDRMNARAKEAMAVVEKLAGVISSVKQEQSPSKPRDAKEESDRHRDDAFSKIWTIAYDIFAESDDCAMWDYLREQVNNGNVSQADAEEIAEDVINTYNL